MAKQIVCRVRRRSTQRFAVVPDEPLQRLTYNAAEAAALLGISERVLRSRCYDGTFPHVKVGTRLLFVREDIARWLAQEAAASVTQPHKNARTIEHVSGSRPR